MGERKGSGQRAEQVGGAAVESSTKCLNPKNQLVTHMSFLDMKVNKVC